MKLKIKFIAETNLALHGRLEVMWILEKGIMMIHSGSESGDIMILDQYSMNVIKVARHGWRQLRSAGRNTTNVLTVSVHRNESNNRCWIRQKNIKQGNPSFSDRDESCNSHHETGHEWGTLLPLVQEAEKTNSDKQGQGESPNEYK